MRRASAWVFGVSGSLALALAACGGTSTQKGDGDGSAGEAGDDGGSAGGTTGAGGSSAGGTSAGGASSGGTSGTGNVPPPPDGDCEDVPACGGDPEGTWQVRETCGEVVGQFLQEPGCENVELAVTIDLDGTYTFESGTVTHDTVTQVRVTFTLDDACAQALVPELSGVTAVELCPLLDIGYRSEMVGSCAAAGVGCRCELAPEASASSGSETYTVEGNQLVDADGGSLNFCVEGDKLFLQTDAVDSAVEGARGELTIELDRQ